jgi:DNA adenine methylase
MKIHAGRPRRPLLRYPGAKNQLASWIVSHFPGNHDSYAEPFGGSAAVLLAKERSRMETYNDLSGELVNLLVALRERRGDLIDAIRYTYYSKAEFEKSLEPTDDPLERARRFYTRCWMSIRPFDNNPSFRRQKFISRGRNGDAAPMTSAAHQFMDIDHLYWYAERLRGVAIESMDALDFIGEYDSPRTLFYVDPPYVWDTRKRQTPIYPHDEMSDSDHVTLADKLGRIRGMAILSGYPCDLYADLYEAAGWQRIDALARIDGGGEATESIWLCPRTQAALDKERSLQMEMCLC